MGSTISSTNIRNEIMVYWKGFKKKEFSEFIASATALRAILSLMIIEPPRKVLEIGAGIGTISNFILENSNAEVYATEPDPQILEMCKTNLTKNLSEKKFKKFTIVQHEGEFSELIKFDWIIIDGQISKSELLRHLVNEDLNLIIIENQRLFSRLHIAFRLCKLGYRYNYLEIDSNDETGIAAFKINHRGTRSNPLIVFEFIAFLLNVLPRMIKLRKIIRVNIGNEIRN